MPPASIDGPTASGGVSSLHISPTACLRAPTCRCSNVLFLVGGLLLELTTNASWAAGFQDTLWYPQWFEMLAIQAVIGVSAGTGLFLTAENRKGAERLVFQAYGLQVLQVRARLGDGGSRPRPGCTACSMPAALCQVTHSDLRLLASCFWACLRLTCPPPPHPTPPRRAS